MLRRRPFLMLALGLLGSKILDGSGMTSELVNWLNSSGGVQQPENVIVFPPGTGTGSSRIVVGAAVPPELGALVPPVAAAIFFYDVVGGVEVGYHFAAEQVSALSGEPGILIGKVTYPTPGVPSSATVADVVKLEEFGTTQMQFYKKTVFDRTERMWWNSVAVPQPIMDCGSFSPNIPNGTTSLVLATQNFNRFPLSGTKVPDVSVTLVSSSGQAIQAQILVNTVTATGFTCQFLRPTATTASFNPTIQWQAAFDV